MKLEQKKEVVRNLTADLKDAENLVFADYQGLPAVKLNLLRQKLRAAGGRLIVVKNTLINRALVKLSLPPASLKGQTAVIASSVGAGSPDGALATIRALFNFIKEEKKPAVTAGFYKGSFLSQEQVLTLSQLPSREVLLAQLLAGFQAPLAGLAATLRAPQRNLLVVLSKVAKKTKAR